VMLRRYPSWSILFATALVVTVVDQISKSLIAESIGPDAERNQIPIIGSILQLRYVENTGAAFGMFQDSTSLLIVISILIIISLGFLFRSLITASKLLAFAFGLQFGGAVGNLIDRVRLGYVVDFIDVPNFPTFNVADSGITVGVVLLAWVLLFQSEPVAEDAPESDDTPESDIPDDSSASSRHKHVATSRNTNA
jgi:signal peptidase II